MDFFSHQERARKNTTKLVVLFALAVMGIIAGIYAVAVAVFQVAGPDGSHGWWNIEIFGFAAGGTLIVVGLGSLYKTMQLRGGGAVVATQLGGRPIQPNTTDPAEQQLRNVVEEMAIAAGTPVPELFVLDNEPGINAFAAGFSPGDAAIGITRGAIDQFTRDELQGVIAHEFSHILNGDMRLNVRLMGVLHGILCLALGGYILLRTGVHSRRDAKGAAAIPLLAVSLIAIGYLGVFFARLIQAAVSRQREFLADASAVQFTRYPDGIGNALKKIAGYETGSRLQTPQAQATSHMFFGNAIGRAWWSAMATHPPIEQRILRIDQSFDKDDAPSAAARQTTPVAAPSSAGFASPAARSSVLTPDRVVARTGDPGRANLDATVRLLDDLPLQLRAALHEPFSARSLIYALLLDKAPTKRKQQIEILRDRAEATTVEEVLLLLPLTSDLPRSHMLPLVDLSIPALRDTSAEQYRSFETTVRALILADNEVNLLEFTILKVLLRHLASSFSMPTAARPRRVALRAMLDECRLLLSTLAHLGHDGTPQAIAAYEAGMAKLPSDGYSRPIVDEQDCSFPKLDTALDRLAQATPQSKRWVLQACAETIAHDQVIVLAEAELLRAIADTLDCPMPLPTVTA